MNSTLRSVLAVLGGIVLGSVANMGLIMASNTIIPPPDGVDPSSMESIKANMHLYQPIHFLMPFLAHAVGTLVGAFLAAMFVTAQKMRTALIVGVIFLVLGMVNVFLLPAPIWFEAVDIILAYIPFAWLGGKLALSFAPKSA